MLSAPMQCSTLDRTDLGTANDKFLRLIARFMTKCPAVTHEHCYEAV